MVTVQEAREMTKNALEMENNRKKRVAEQVVQFFERSWEDKEDNIIDDDDSIRKSKFVQLVTVACMRGEYQFDIEIPNLATYLKDVLKAGPNEDEEKVFYDLLARCGYQIVEAMTEKYPGFHIKFIPIFSTCCKVYVSWESEQENCF